jgi:hypothetical protein
MALFTRRLGPLPVWVWFLIFVALVAFYIIWRRRKTPATGAVASNAYTAQNLTNQPSTLVPYTSDIFLTVQQPGAQGPPGDTGPVGPAGPTGPQPVPPPPPAPPQPPATQPTTVTVQPSENLYGIPLRYGITWNQFMNLNGGHDAFYNTFVFGPDKDALGSWIPHTKGTQTYKIA